MSVRRPVCVSGTRDWREPHSALKRSLGAEEDGYVLHLGREEVAGVGDGCGEGVRTAQGLGSGDVGALAVVWWNGVAARPCHVWGCGGAGDDSRVGGRCSTC